MKEKKFKKHFRIYFRNGHPAYIVDEEGNTYAFHRVTHSKTSGGRNNIKIDNPQTLGSDRVCDAVCVIEEYKVPAIIIDMGTATTISVIDKNKNHIGGMIIPGLKTSLDSLSSNASQLPYISLDDPKVLIGKNTIDCMKSGIIYGNVALIDGLIDRIKDELGEDYVVIATGGLSKLVIKHSKHNIIYDENLLLKGLYYIYKKNN